MKHAWAGRQSNGATLALQLVTALGVFLVSAAHGTTAGTLLAAGLVVALSAVAQVEPSPPSKWSSRASPSALRRRGQARPPELRRNMAQASRPISRLGGTT